MRLHSRSLLYLRVVRWLSSNILQSDLLPTVFLIMSFVQFVCYPFLEIVSKFLQYISRVAYCSHVLDDLNDLSRLLRCLWFQPKGKIEAHQCLILPCSYIEFPSSSSTWLLNYDDSFHPAWAIVHFHIRVIDGIPPSIISYVSVGSITNSNSYGDSLIYNRLAKC